jgi:hypothetical protein
MTCALEHKKCGSYIFFLNDFFFFAFFFFILFWALFFYQAVRARVGDRCARAQEDERCFVRGLPYGGTHDGEACLLNLQLVQEFLAQHAPGT